MMTTTLACLLSLAVQGPLDTYTHADVTVDSGRQLATVSAAALGIGVAVWDKHMTDYVASDHIQDAGFQVIRYPGGSYADLYQWKTGTPTKGMEGTIQPNTGFDDFMKFSKRSKATPLITVNYGSNAEGTGGADPAYAAEWVRHANVEQKYGVKYWEIGNEVYGNGFYNGKGWEVDLHAPDKGLRLKNPLLGPSEYGKNVALFAKAMKAVDPSIKIGAVLTGPGEWPDGVEPEWNPNVLAECGKDIDFVVVHWYGSGDTPEKMLDSLGKVPSLLSRLKGVLAKAGVPDLKIWMTEGDAGSFNMRHVGALFAAEHLLTWWENGAEHVDWWNMHNGLGVGSWGYDDQGILSSGHETRGVVQPEANTPFPPFYGIEAVRKVVGPDDVLIGCTSPSKSLMPHAVKRKDGRTGLVLINRDRDHAVLVSLKGVGAGRFETWSYVRGAASLKHAWSDRLMIPADSVVSVLLEKPRN